MKRVVVLAVMGVAAACVMAVVTAGADAGLATTTGVVLHPGQSKKIGRYTVVCTTKKVARTATRIVLHPGYRVKVNGVAVSCVKLAAPQVTPIPPPPPPPAVGTRSNPYPVGTRAGDSNWAITVNSTNFDAWPVIQAANMFNDPPPPGGQDVMANLTLTYLGPGSTDLTPLIIDLGVVGQGGVEYKSFTNSCGVPPSPREIDYSTVFSGATIPINICWQVAATDVPTLQLVYNEQTWFALK